MYFIYFIPLFHFPISPSPLGFSLFTLPSMPLSMLGSTLGSI